MRFRVSKEKIGDSRVWIKEADITCCGVDHMVGQVQQREYPG